MIRLPRFLIHDRDSNISGSFDEVFSAGGTEVIRTPYRASRANAFAERWVLTVRTECLDWILIRSRRHAELVLRNYIEHYGRGRPHRGLDLKTPESRGDPPKCQGAVSPRHPRKADTRVRKCRLTREPGFWYPTGPLLCPR
jgi:hypothetical protein